MEKWVAEGKVVEREIDYGCASHYWCDANCDSGEYIEHITDKLYDFLGKKIRITIEVIE